MGLPLALKLLSTHLCGKNTDNWNTILTKLNDTDSLHTPKDKILAVLKISFDGLDPDYKNVFLDITCFYRNWREEYVKGVLDSDLSMLIDKSLISVQNGRIEMQDLIQEMGWHIASQEKPKSRLWQLNKDRVDMLSGKMANKDIEGINWFVRWDADEKISFEITFKKMTNLKMFKVGGGSSDFHLMDDYLPSSLRWLEIAFYHFTSLPESFASSELIGLSLRFSSLEKWSITQKLDKLILLDLSFSESLCCKSFVGFAVYFLSSKEEVMEAVDDIYCKVRAKLSYEDNIMEMKFSKVNV
ncbi:TMV resistance protein N-like [Ipomoea triloba]|uniref:TMV resistance protein N-like n=1 Tax=Ipomoea triloba TaxID=35885 RepID=UPI00125E2563|nr:TMV resistance protein N-like [Ipomoea triloba]